ncbi:hypothetical protein CEXT_664131 [Caerostris extrusa]|uniref:Uncharacterized protein n=1 Tax=Caerostris extrusa TaxID=172846 RepID=A0AAV4XXC0_CAEEX|nr:hypothetical protein CEXT_664131 [Caerostris extrusa]
MGTRERTKQGYGTCNRDSRKLIEVSYLHLHSVNGGTDGQSAPYLHQCFSNCEAPHLNMGTRTKDKARLRDLQQGFK